MLKISIHAGSLEERVTANQLAVLDIAYQNVDALADYQVALQMRGVGSIAPATVLKYPRWSASLWDLTARALCQALYRANQAPPSPKADKRCAYATRICATIERATANDHALELGSVEILQKGKQRGRYTATFDEDILGRRTAEFEYGCKALNPSELLMRAICWAYFGSDLLGKKPSLILPPTMPINGADHFHVAALDEPAMTGYLRYQARLRQATTVDSLHKAISYVMFLQAS